MIAIIAAALVALAAIFLLALGVLAWVRPQRAGRFLLGFAGSARLHFLELAVRVLVGVALIHHAPWALWPRAFALFGWMLVITSLCLALLPWRWHQRFASQAVPRALSLLPLVGVVSVLLGAALLYGGFGGYLG